MSTCRFMFDNLVSGPAALGVSSARPGMVGSPAAEALGSATCVAAGQHTGDLDQVLVVEIDSLAAGSEVGLATFRWKRESAGAWEASGVPTSVSLTPLADGVSVKWVPGPGQELYLGDRWTILATGRQGPQALLDRDRDTAWRGQACAGQWVRADLGAAQRVRALVLADHNLGEAATATLRAGDTPEPDDPLWRFDPAGGLLAGDDGGAGVNPRATARTYIDGGILKYAAAGESCFEDGKLSIQPAATNLLTYSEQLDNAAWAKLRSDILPNVAVGPDDGLTADKLVQDTTLADTHGVYRQPTVDDDTDYVFSVFAKAAENSWLMLWVRTKDTINTYREAFFNLSAGTLGTCGTDAAGIEAVGGGWYRCWIRHNSSSGSGTFRVTAYLAEDDGDYVMDGDGSSGLYLWGAQLEAGIVPTAYIPTTSSPASRTADGVNFPLAQALKNSLSAEQPAPTAALTQAAGDIVLATVAGGAMVMPAQGSAVDLSPYAGYVLKVVDSAGKIAWARIGAAGTGLALGSELVANGDFSAWTDDDPDGWSLYGTEDASNYVTENPAGGCQVVRGASGSILPQQNILEAGKLYNYSVEVIAVSSRAGFAFGYPSGWDSPGTKSGYFTGINDRPYLGVYTYYGSTTATFDNVSAKQVTAPPATGVWLESIAGAADKTWASIQTGFNPNGITSWAVYPASQWRAEGTLVLRGLVFPFASAAIPATAKAIVAAAESPYNLLYTESGPTLRTNDGTGSATVTPSFAAGQPIDVAVKWSSKINLKQVDCKLSSSPTWTLGTATVFDGVFDLGSYLNLGYSPSYPFNIGCLEFYDSWLADPLEKTLSPWDYPDYSQALGITRPHLAYFLNETYRYWRLELDDPANPEGYLRASLLYLGGCFAPQRNFRAGYGRGTVATRKLVVSGGGKLAGSAGALATYYQLEFTRLDQADAQGFEAMLAAAHAGGQGGLRPLFFTPFAEDPGQTLYCLPGEELSRQEAPGGRWDLSLRLEEVVKSDV